MEDISKGTVALLLILVVALTAIFTFRIMNSAQTVVIQQPSQTVEPGNVGKLSVQIIPPALAQSEGNLKLYLTKGG